MSNAAVSYTDGDKVVLSPDGFKSKDELTKEFGHGVIVKLRIFKDKKKGIRPEKKKKQKGGKPSHPVYEWIKKKTRLIKLY